MSTIATNSHWPIGPAILAGAVLSAMCFSPGSTSAQPDAPQVDPQADIQVAAPTPHRYHWHQIGRASWYGRPFQGQATASGELYNMNSMTCAHRSLPLGASVPVSYTHLQSESTNTHQSSRKRWFIGPFPLPTG